MTRRLSQAGNQSGPICQHAEGPFATEDELLGSTLGRWLEKDQPRTTTCSRDPERASQETGPWRQTACVPRGTKEPGCLP
jgi:hypothetical protein